MKSELQAPAVGRFDMDIVNAMFKDTVLLLPGDYLTINSHWEVNELLPGGKEECRREIQTGTLHLSHCQHPRRAPLRRA